MRDIPGPTPGQEVTTPSSAGEAAAASADTSSHSTRHFACDLTMHSASLIPLQLWCAKNAIYIQLWPLGTIEVENSIKGTVKKLGSRNHLGGT